MFCSGQPSGAGSQAADVCAPGKHESDTRVISLKLDT
jgi:hypothetical protein